MLRKIFIFISLILFCSFRLVAISDESFLIIEEVCYNKDIRFPFFVSKIPEKSEVANRINKRLQHILFYDDEIINTKNIQLIKKHLFIRNDSIDQSGISSLNYSYDFYPHFLRITIDIDCAGGPYPVGARTDYLQFDLEKGELILMPDLIDGRKYFDFLEKFWLNDCRNSIRASHQCAYGNQTGDYESDKAYILDGDCEFQCHKMNHEFILGKDSIFIRNNSSCFPHVWQNCNFGCSKYLKVENIREFLSDYGKWLLGINDLYSEVNPFYHFVGKINKKYKISMSIFRNKDDSIIGSYFYWNQNKKILLKGQINIESKVIFLNEFVDKLETGGFELEWDDFLYSTDGFWTNPSKEIKLDAELMNVYDFTDRNYYR